MFVRKNQKIFSLIFKYRSSSQIGYIYHLSSLSLAALAKEEKAAPARKSVTEIINGLLEFSILTFLNPILFRDLWLLHAPQMTAPRPFLPLLVAEELRTPTLPKFSLRSLLLPFEY